MQRLRAADEPHRGHAEAERVHRALGGGDDLGMIGEAEVVVCAEIESLARARAGGDPDASALRPGQEPLAFQKARRLDLIERFANTLQERVRHWPLARLLLCIIT